MESINERLAPPTNQWAKSLYILIDSYNGGVNMLKVLQDYDRNFWKFQTRVSDILKWHPDLIISKTSIPFHSKLSDTGGYYTHYTLISNKVHCINLYNKINKLGLYRSHKPKVTSEK
jgi:hypothetical protein